MTRAENIFVRTGAVLIAILLLGLLLGTAAPARANFEQDRQDCNSAAVDLDLQIAACTRLIRKGRIKGAA
ncbi:MAG: hypothetical protein ACE5GT_03080, partial [Rhodospirillales bacterium]